MNITVRSYGAGFGVTEESDRVRAFLLEQGYCEFTYARWEWMITHSYLDRDSLPKIGLWEQDGRLVALATFDCVLGDTFLLTLPGYECLQPELLIYARERLAKDGTCTVVIRDDDRLLQQAAARMGFVPTPYREHDAVFYPDQTSMKYQLPPGFWMTDFQQTLDYDQYNRVLWKGFNHEINGEGPFVPKQEDREQAAASLLRPHVDLSLKIAVVSPEGNFAAHCGMWYEQAAGYAVIEPVATDPAFRKLGLGRAAVLEGIRRVAERGARYAVVGSSQPFYYHIGLRPLASASKWVKEAER